MNKIEIRQKEGSEDQIMNGSNTEVLLNGKLLKGVTGVRFEVTGGSLAKVVLEMFGEVKITGEIEELTQEYTTGGEPK